jgi:hypothetical protein
VDHPVGGHADLSQAEFL